MISRLASVCFVLLLMLLVAACCGNSAVDCQDAHADSLFLRFNLQDSASGNGFRVREIDSVLLIRKIRDTTATYTPPDSSRLAPDTVRVVRLPTAVADYILLEHTAPFTRKGLRRLPDYDYTVYLPNTAEKLRFELTMLEINGDFEADGCVTCYRNRRKQLLVNGKPVDVYSSNNHPEEKPVVLSR
ncbi:hypothetical protein [Hymenobacter sp. DG25A]|uniref:hypothetical protein n=1 Tax=Hymenobacter sp. DG25A TaxID=1385663 RepID=UPI0006BD4891|nr:hypothetical protein [Hymenobacter sp. DG25A]ALD21460.1 hypothetical protein AM218_09820 [Hymenobacter sp. DG25A]